MNLDNRELALLIWLVLIAVVVHWKVRNYEALFGLWKALAQRQILYAFIYLACYVATCIWLLSEAGWWQLSNLKTTALWTISFLIVTIFNFNKIESDQSYFRTMLIEAVGIGAFLSFISSSHPFSLLLELIITFLLIILSVAVAISVNDPKLRPAHNLLATLLAAISLLIFTNSAYHIITEFSEFATLNTAREFALPILLTAMSLPFLYGLHVYCTYERIFISLNFSIKDPTLRRKIRRNLIAKFRLDVVGINRWHRHVGIFGMNNEADFNISIAEIKRVRNHEKNPPVARPKIGWPPHEAIKFLSVANLPTNDYHHSYTGWLASSSYLELDKELIPNNVAYYIEGSEFVASKLKLILNINSPQMASDAQETFLHFINMLILAAIPDEPQHSNIAPRISADAPPLRIGNYLLTLERENWPNGITGGYELRFTIETIVSEQESAASESLTPAI